MPRPVTRRATSSAGRRTRVRPALRAALLPLLLLLVGLALPGSALGHAQLVSVDPADGARLESSPAAVTLTFNEPVGLAAGGLRVIDSTGATVDEGEDTSDGPRVSQPLPALPDGWYIATWGIISEDGHIIRASSTFAVGDADAAERPDAMTDDRSLVSGLARAIGDLGILVAAGAWAAWWLLGARLVAVRRLAFAATVVALAGTAAWAAVEFQDGGAGWMETSAATLAIVRGALLAVALVPAGASLFVPAGATVLALLTLGGGGHSAGDAVATGLLVTHLLAAVAWLGAAPAVLLTLRDRTATDDVATGVVRRFSRLAGFALVGVGVAGAALTWNLTDGLAGGLTTPWVLVLGAKVALVGIAALLGAIGRRHLGGAPDRGRLRRLFLVDAGLLVGVAVLSAGLTLSSPHSGHVGHGEHGSEDARCSAIVGEGSVSMILSPARVGTNEVTIGGIPDGTRSVSLSFSHELTDGAALTMDATADPDGPWVATGALPLAGSWEVAIDVRVDTFTQVSGTCRVRVEP